MQTTLTTFLNPYQLVKMQDMECVLCLQIFLHLFYRNMHFISGINLLIVPYLIPPKEGDILPTVSRVSNAQMGVISHPKHLLLAYNGTEK